jgi:hypothetical protein
VAEPLRAIADGLWVAERPLKPLPFLDIGTRMSVIRLPDGAVLLHSPVEADEPTRQAVAALGPVAAIACPNKVHHLFAAGWKEAHPKARLLAAPGLPTKRRDLAFDRVLDEGPEPSWAPVVDWIHVEGMPILEEVVFLHRPSRTLLLADLAFHPTRASRPGLRRWTWLTRVRDGFGPNAVVRLAVRDRAAARRSLDRVLAWDFERVVVTHGEVLEGGGREALRRAWAWL